MTKITLYPIDNTVTGSDKWVGTDVGGGNFTKNFTPDNLAQYFDESEVVQSNNTIRFFYDTIAIGDSRVFGSISFATEVGATVDFSTITSFVLSKKTKSSRNVADLLLAFNKGKIFLQQCDNKNAFAILKIQSIAERPTEPNFYDVTVEVEYSVGSLLEDKDYFLSLQQYNYLLSGDLSYVHTQASASTDWTVAHSLGKFPSVTIVDSAGTEVIGNVTHVDNNNLTINFTSSFSGKAHIN